MIIERAMTMKCKICDASDVEVTYSGKIRNGAPGNGMTTENVEVYRCKSCSCIWHEPIVESVSLYQSDNYRESMGETVSLENFCNKHDIEVLDKLKYTGTQVFRDKLVMDIGCGGGSHANFLKGSAKAVILVEPNENFASQLREKGYEVFAYAEDALAKYNNSIDVITSYDVIEHVDEPIAFLRTIYNLLSPGGAAYIGTPTEYPVLRKLLGKAFDSFVFSVQHPFVFSRDSLEVMAQKVGFSKYEVLFYQRFGLGNLLAWLQTGQPCGDKAYDFITTSLDKLYKSEMAKESTAEYLILSLHK